MAARGEPRIDKPTRAVALTAAEERVLEQLRRGLKHSAIARSSGRSVHTVRTISRNAREKFGARSVVELLEGLDAGKYAVAPRKAEVGRFGLASALETLDRARSGNDPHAIRTLRLHHDEITVLLRLGDACQSIVSGSEQIVADLDSVVRGVERLLSRERDGRAALAGEIAQTMGALDARRRTVRGPSELSRFTSILVRRPCALHGAERAAVLDAFRSGYATGLHDDAPMLRRRLARRSRSP